MKNHKEPNAAPSRPKAPATDYWERALEAVPEPIFTTNNEWQLTWVNQALADRVGQPPEALIGRRCYEIIHGTTEPPEGCPHVLFLRQGGNAPLRAEVEHTLGGTYVISVTPLRGPGEELQGTIHVSYDLTEHTQAESRLTAALAEAEWRYRTLFDGKGMMALCLDRETGRIYDANPAACSLYGCSREELRGKHPDDFSPAGEAGWARRLTEVAEGRSTHFGCVQQLPDGEVREVEVYPSDIEVQGRKMVCCILEDVTARRRAAEDLADSARFEALVARISRELVSIAPEGCDEVLQPALQEITLALGLSGAFVIQGSRSQDTATVSHGWPLNSERIPLGIKFSVEEAPWAFAQVKAGTIIRLDETHALPPEAASDRGVFERFGTARGLVVPLITGGDPLGCICFLSPETDWEWSEELIQRMQTVGEVFASALARKRGHEHLVEELRFDDPPPPPPPPFARASASDLNAVVDMSLGKYAEFLQASRAAMVEVDHATGKLAIRAAYPIPAVAGSPRTSSALNDDLPWLTREIATGQPLMLCNLDRDLPQEASQERAWFEARQARSCLSVPLVSGDTVVGAFLFEWTEEREDCSEFQTSASVLAGEALANAILRLQAEARGDNLRANLLHVSRVALSGMLLSTLAHELHQPLAAIVSNAQAGERFLESASYDRDEIAAILADIAEDGTRAGRIISRLQDFVRRRRSKRELVDLNQAIREVAAMVARDAQFHGVQMRYRLSPDLPAVPGDRVQLQQVVLNLIINARQALAESGTREGEIWVETSLRDSGKVTVAVEDNGPGLAPEAAADVFAAFVTTRPGGMGLGLAISQGIAEGHEGRLETVPKEGPGARFELSLPTGGPSI